MIETPFDEEEKPAVASASVFSSSSLLLDGRTRAAHSLNRLMLFPQLQLRLLLKLFRESKGIFRTGSFFLPDF